ncbi:hypothetical protein QJS10_CPA07g00575 [Acorus calamus]|uniref:Endonuclease/exonuclease/phosphatase domain-containing protein n=1 Tax=Acorus calamus TaxID=4465 RepID=A0AAV9EE07_ACOCL|nr:hypothetical protein QJS10_CPA07g00575 [Acorus calamus]
MRYGPLSAARGRNPWRRGFSDRPPSANHRPPWGDVPRQQPPPAFCPAPEFRPHQRPPPRQRPDDHRYWAWAPSPPLPHCERFAVLSYNILADYLARDHQKMLYAHVPPHVLDWEWRKKRILLEFGLWSPDIMCLQEVDKFKDIEESLKGHGYSGIWKMRTGAAQDGCAVFWRTNRFKLLHEEQIEFNQLGMRDNVAQICVLESRSQSPTEGHSAASSSRSCQSTGANRVVVCNIHVLYNPKRGDIKLGQIRVLLDRANSTSRMWNNASIIICGDFNCTPKSPLYNFIAEQKLNLSGLAKNQVSGQSSVRIYTPRPYYGYGLHRPQASPDKSTNPSVLNGMRAVELEKGVSSMRVYDHQESQTGMDNVSPGLQEEIMSSCSDNHVAAQSLLGCPSQKTVERNNELNEIAVNAKNVGGQGFAPQIQDCPRDAPRDAYHEANGSQNEERESPIISDSSETNLYRQNYLTNSDAPDICVDTDLSSSCRNPELSCGTLNISAEIMTEGAGLNDHGDDGKLAGSYSDEPYQPLEQSSIEIRTRNRQSEGCSVKSDVTSSELFCTSEDICDAEFLHQLHGNNEVLDLDETHQSTTSLAIHAVSSSFPDGPKGFSSSNQFVVREEEVSFEESVSNAGQFSPSNAPLFDVYSDPYAWTPMEIEVASGNAECKLLEHELGLKSSYTEVEDYAGTKDSFKEPQVTSYNSKFMGTVDYIWRSEGLQTVRVLDTLPKHIMRRTYGFPTWIQWLSIQTSKLLHRLFLLES